MTRFMSLLPLILLTACAGMQPKPPAAPPPPASEFIVPEGTEFVSGLFGYSQAVRTGPWITVSAQPGFDIAKRGFPEAFPEQVAAAFDNLKTVLEAAGASMTDVVEITTYQLDMQKFNAVVDARNEAFGEHRPTWTAVGVSGLPLPSMQFQVSARAFVAGPNARPLPQEKPETKEPVEYPKRFMNRPGY